MAITVHQQPDKFSAVYNDIVYVVSSTNSGEVNYKYVFDLYEGTGTTLLARLKILPDPDGYGIFRANRILEDYVSYDISLPLNEIFTCPNSYKGYLVKFGEEYGTTPTTYAALSTGTKKYAVNAVFGFIEFDSDMFEPFLVVNPGIKRFLTNAPDTQYVHLGQNGFLHLVTDTADVIAAIRVRTYDSAGTIIDDVTETNPFSGLGSENYRFIRVPAGPYNVNEWLGIIDASVSYYTIEALNNNVLPTASTELFTFYIEEECKYDTYRLHFLNRLGGFDSFNFTKASRKTTDVNRSTYDKNPNELVLAAYAYQKKSRGKVQYDTVVKDKVRIASDWISEEEAEWLKELITSPEVYLEVDSSTIVGVNLLTNGYEVKQKVNDKLINVEIEFEYSFTEYRQRG